eukprot:Sspe_Gene.66174::Locus_39115_Transcript_1_1_Confidence_1.000_Length_1310::g.66174::m.66174
MEWRSEDSKKEELEKLKKKLAELEKLKQVGAGNATKSPAKGPEPEAPSGQPSSFVLKPIEPEPKRVDPSDGKEYTKQEFYECYGSNEQWNHAPTMEEWKEKYEEQAEEEEMVMLKKRLAELEHRKAARQLKREQEEEEKRRKEQGKEEEKAGG